MSVILCLTLYSAASQSQANDSKPSRQNPEFYDEPKFTVSDVADPTGLGGHGSNATAASRESLAKDVRSIKGPSTHTSLDHSGTRADLENALQHDPDNAELHRWLGEVEEQSGNSLAAVKEFQRAAELDPSEESLFAWGSELLDHGAAEPAVEVFSKGHRLFPRSVRMLTALGTAWYLRGSYQQAADNLCDASDLEPENDSPHIFLGKILNAETSSSERVRSTLKRYASLRPENATANYLYALGLWKQLASSHEPQLISQVEWLLKKSTRLDPNFSPAYLQLGIVYTAAQDFPKALVALKKAAELDAKSEQAHYRLAQVYRHLGQNANAQREMQAYQQSAREHEEELAREQHSRQVFVYSQKPAEVPK